MLARLAFQSFHLNRGFSGVGMYSSYGKFCDGQVVDFLSFHIGDIPWAVWPSFNVADTAICVGVGLFILSNFIRPEPEKKNAEKKSA